MGNTARSVSKYTYLWVIFIDITDLIFSYLKMKWIWNANFCSRMNILCCYEQWCLPVIYSIMKGSTFDMFLRGDNFNCLFNYKYKIYFYFKILFTCETYLTELGSQEWFMREKLWLITKPRELSLVPVVMFQLPISYISCTLYWATCNSWYIKVPKKTSFSLQN